MPLRSTVADTPFALTLLQTQMRYSSEPPAPVEVPLLTTCALTQSAPGLGGFDECEGEGVGLAVFDGDGDGEALFDGLDVFDGVGLDVGLLV